MESRYEREGMKGLGKEQLRILELLGNGTKLTATQLCNALYGESDDYDVGKNEYMRCVHDSITRLARRELIVNETALVETGNGKRWCKIWSLA